MVDIKLNEQFQLTQGATGDAPLVMDAECILQNIQLEAMSQEGELFYDDQYGWSLIDFMQQTDDDMVLLELKERIRMKLESNEHVESDSIQINAEFVIDGIQAQAIFSLGDGVDRSLDIRIDNIQIEVIYSD